MNGTNIFINSLENTQFFSVINSIIILGDILYHDKQLPNDEKVESINIINALCRFLDDNRHSKDKILALGQKLLQNTDFYGSKPNESVDIKFLNSMLNNIIANTVFSKYGNIFGYLSAIVNSIGDLKLSSVKNKIVKNLHRQKFLMDNGTFTILSNVTIARITETIIFPLFPQPKKDLEIINFKYIYAQAGWFLLRSAKEDVDNPSFSKLIALALNVEQGVLQGEMDPSALRIFQLPALLYYTHQKDNGIKRKNLKSIMVNTNFWHRVYNRLFTDFNVTQQKLIILQKQSPAYRFQMAFSKFKTRTQMAEEVLQRNCPNETDFASTVIDYKNHPGDFFCNKRLMPNVNDMFSKQNEMIAKKYYFYEIYLIHQVFDDDLKTFINKKNVMIKPIQEFWKNRCFRCAAYTNRPKLSGSIDLFQISDGRISAIYALIRSKNGMRLLPAQNMDAFLDEIGLNSRAKLNVPFMAEDMKSASEKDDFNSFAIYIAKSREKMFLANLKSTGYEATTTEKVVNFFKHLIPFYACAESIRQSESSTQTVMACIVDSLVLVPFFGLATSVGTKITTATMRSTLLRLGVEMEAFTLREAFRAVMKIGFRLFASDIIESFSQIITKQFIKDFGIAVFRCLDPGIEFSYTLTKAGVRTLMKNWKMIKNKVSTDILKNLITVTDVNIGSYKGYPVHVQSMTGQDGFGFKKIRFQDKIVELRKIQGYSNEMPVVLVNNAKKRMKYKILDLETGKLSKTEWEETNGVLKVAAKPLRVHLKIIQSEGLSGKGLIQKSKVRNQIRSLTEDSKNFALELVENPWDKQMLTEVLKFYVLENLGKRPINLIQHWLEYKTLPSWCEDYKLLDADLLTSLRFDSFIEDFEMHYAQKVLKIMDSYGHQYVRDVIKVDVNMLLHYYLDRHLYDTITFNDQFAIANFMTSGYSRIHLDDFEAWNMKRAFYRAALRQFDDLSSQTLIDDYLHSTDVISSNLFPMEIGKVFEVNEFITFTREMHELAPSLEIQSFSATNVIHRVKLDHQCLAVYLHKFLPFNTNQVVLLPGVRLSLVNYEYKVIDGINIVVMNWKNVAFDKSKWLADTANKIKHINDQEHLANSYILEFDTNLL